MTTALREQHREGMSLHDALGAAVGALTAHAQDGEDPTLTPGQLEVAVLDRTRPNRLFKRLVGPQLEALINGTGTGGGTAGKRKAAGGAPRKEASSDGADPGATDDTA